MNKDFFTKQLNLILDEYKVVKAKSKYDDLSDIDLGDITVLITKAKAAIQRITGDKSEYYKDVDLVLKRTNQHEFGKLKHVMGTVEALKSDLQNDFLKSLSDIIQAEVFSDYLEMSDHLLTEGYKDASAVLTGSTLEAHLKELCKINGIDLEIKNSKGELITKKADLINSDLAKAGVYTAIYQKQITAWLAIRNSAAHGQFTNYISEEVKLMILGVRQFILTTK